MVGGCGGSQNTWLRGCGWAGLAFMGHHGPALAVIGLHWPLLTVIGSCDVT